MTAPYDDAWARRKLARARAHLADLQQLTAGWVDPAEHPLSVELSENQREVRLVLDLSNPPPIHEWSLVIGDCVHNARTALDVFVWMNSTELPQAERGRAAYPLLPTLTDEEEMAKPEPSDRLEDQPRKVRETIGPKVAGLPEPLRSRVLDNMRWFDLPHEGNIVRHNRIPLLFELDNADKHRLSLDLRASADTIEWDLRAWSAAGEPLDLAFDWSEDTTLTTGLPEQAVVGTGLASARIDRMTGTAKASLGLRVHVLDLALDTGHWLETLIDDVEGLLDVLAGRTDFKT
jgi:hypothetical protein